MREQRLVDDPEFSSYYGKPVIKAPVWKQPDVPVYLFVGGVAGVSALLAEGAAATGRPALERYGRLAASGGAVISTVALIHDLGKPSRFLHMLRVFKVTSPLSVGSFILAPFGALSTAAAASALTGRLPRLGRLAGVGTAALGAPLATYTAALITNTAVPAWQEARREMPFVFAGSAAAAGGGLAIACVPIAESGPARTLAVGGALLDVAGLEAIHRRLGWLAEPYDQGRPGLLLKGARALNVAGATLAVAGRRSRAASVLAGTALASASLMTRFGIFQAGLASAKDPKYTVIPQRERLRQREADASAEKRDRAPA